jgi:hypothetical protein
MEIYIGSKVDIITRTSPSFIDLITQLGGLSKVVSAVISFIVASFAPKYYTQQIA